MFNISPLWGQVFSSYVPAGVLFSSRPVAQAGEGGAGTTLAISTVSSATSGDEVASLTFSHTAPNDEAAIIVACSQFENTSATVAHIRYGGADMTFQEDTYTDVGGGSFQGAYLYSLTNPPSGANNVVVTFGGNIAAAVCYAVSFVGVNQTVPFGTAGSASANGAPSVNVPSASGDIVVDIFNYYDPSNDDTLTAGAGQTQIFQRRQTTQEVYAGGSSEVATGNPTVMSWTGGSSDFDMVGIAVKD